MSDFYSLRRLISAVVTVLIAASAFFVRFSIPQPLEQARLGVQCEYGPGPERLPSSRYFFNPNYGWFDRTHFNTGKPGQVIADVRRTVRAGGGTITIEQDVHDGAAGYSGAYSVSPEISREDEMGVALGIYRDWSIRFEAWQAQLPQTLVGLLSPFAVEDLPSHYLGFYAQAHGMDVYDVFACYLPDTRETEDTPPRFTTHQDLADEAEDSLNYPQRLANRELLPMVHKETGWENVPWPPEMQMEVIDASSGLWELEDEESWYFAED